MIVRIQQDVHRGDETGGCSGHRTVQFVVRARGCCSQPPIHTEGMAVTTSASGYHNGPPAGPIAFHARMPSRLSTCPMPARIHTCFIGFAGASRAVTYPPSVWNAKRYPVARTKRPLDITWPTGGKIPVPCMRASVATDNKAAVREP